LHTHIVCNPFHSTCFTTPHKDRLTIVDLLRGGPRTYRFNELAQRLAPDQRPCARRDRGSLWPALLPPGREPSLARIFSAIGWATFISSWCGIVRKMNRCF
jgi:hypothetical protein